MPAPISLQLYTLREQAAVDYTGIVTQVADMGYIGVEPAGYPGTTVEGAAKLYKDLGLKCATAHLGLPVGDDKQSNIDQAGILGVDHIVTGKGPDDFKTLDLLKATCELFNEAALNAKEAGFKFSIHNHWWEFSPLEETGEVVYKHMLEHLSQDVHFEVDTYWVQTGGCDPAAVVKELGSRCPLLHIKDGPCDREKDMTACGEGIVDIPAIVAAAGDTTEWMIVELDRCETDMVEAVKKSYDYLVGEGLAAGNK
ncbi:MAG: sugar phosphate isomerase/epimerase [Gemmatimonadetes bacterium]|jgi:sugar phosphate isomerase/epimerase|nr:sugar phosphate isomerase/epimerase [Gemmatimonadota bacterium]MBT6145614.1 sugar phosphate isomerase/epimerase [Gemmatimonadota bacterium]